VFEIVLERVAEKDLRRLSEDVHDRVVEAISALAANPRPAGSKKLAGSKSNWRIRVGEYRVLRDRGHGADRSRLPRAAPQRSLPLRDVAGFDFSNPAALTLAMP
jgi:mRNA interferase RelE/StbE